MAGVEVTGEKVASWLALLASASALSYVMVANYKMRHRKAQSVEHVDIGTLNRKPVRCWTSWGETRACDVEDAAAILRASWGVVPGASLDVEVPLCANKTALHLWLRETAAGPHRLELCENDAHRLVEIENNPPTP